MVCTDIMGKEDGERASHHLWEMLSIQSLRLGLFGHHHSGEREEHFTTNGYGQKSRVGTWPLLMAVGEMHCIFGFLQLVSREVIIKKGSFFLGCSFLGPLA